ncbi:hypothetical protein [Arthrobacter sp. NPDC056727]|uniref:hypothetical protein n=1 Tax=Arthrobacter sp. NPDC056727 TaxID=3345927 RepID=UPI00367130F4
MLTAFDRVTPVSARVLDQGQATSAALSSFSGTCRELKARLEQYGQRVYALDADIRSFPTKVETVTMVKGEQIRSEVHQDWTGDADLSGRRNELQAEAMAIYNAYLEAQNTCASALAGVSGGEAYSQEPAAAHKPSGNFVDEVLYNLGSAVGIANNDADHPWGREVVPYRPNGTLGLLQGIGAGAVELVDGVWSLTLTGDQSKRDAAWGGINALISNPSSFDLRQQLLSFTHAEEAETNASWAFGATLTGIASFAIGGGAGAAVKSGTAVSRAGLVAEKLSIATMDTARLGHLSAALGRTASGLESAGAFLAKPGSLTLKISDVLMPQTTAKVLDTMTHARVAVFSTLDAAKSTAAETVAGTQRTAATAMTAVAEGLRTVDHAVPKTQYALAHGAALPVDAPRPATWLDNKAASIREANPPAFVPPERPSTGTGPTSPSVKTEPFVRPDHISETVVLRHGDKTFPVSRRDNFAARTGLKPNTEYIIEHRGKMKDETGLLQADSVEKYYTDATGAVTRVDTYAGVKGAWSPELNKPMPNVTYNVVAQVDGGLHNTFTLVMDSHGHLASAKGHISSTLVGDANRNGWQQLKAGRLGGPGYDGGHAAPSALGFIGERAGLFPQHSWQNRGIGEEIDSVRFGRVESDIVTEVKRRLGAGQPVSLNWSMTTTPSARPGLPARFRLRHGFTGEQLTTIPFNNMPKS